MNLKINQMMNDHSWGYGMGWGMWIIPIAAIIIIVILLKGRRGR
jgi:hypothetical protein